MQSARAMRTEGVDMLVSVPNRSWADMFGDYLALTKPGIVLWLMITALCAMAVAAKGIPPLVTAGATLVGLALSAGGAHAVNMWYDRDIDQVMDRTKTRPVAAGRVSARNALMFGVIAGLVAFGWLVLMVNWLTAWTCLSGYLTYVFVYTVWLKRRSPQNIVIGGAAGAVPPMVGWAAVTDHLGLTAWLMFSIIFLWTPPHFWALALYKQDDYRRANIPMMPIIRGKRATAIQTVIYTGLVILASLTLWRVAHLSWEYFGVAVVAGAWFMVYQVRVLVDNDPKTRWAKKAFGFSLIYIALLFVAMAI